MLLVVISLLGVTSVLGEASYGESRCFDCNYRPSGYSKGSYGQVGHNAGAAQCGLVRYGDADALDKWACSSGQCFIRLDKNGLVYRGCANQENLPLGVNAYQQCQYQGGSLYYFCKGDLCNGGQIGNLCGYKPSYTAKQNPCDGRCYGNPSGLFRDAYNPNGFIQCGCGNDYGNTCTCCRPFYLKCPYGSTWNDAAKVCTKSGNGYPPKPSYPKPAHPKVHVQPPKPHPKAAVY